jgi:hypothetical protein
MFGDTADKENVNHGDLYKDLAEEINKQEGHGFIGSSADATKWESALALCETERTKLITTGVFGGAYKIERPGNEMLTHAVLVTPGFNWDTGRSLCKKVKNIMDDRTQWAKDPPTCTACLSKWNRLGKEHPEYMDWELEQ